LGLLFASRSWQRCSGNLHGKWNPKLIPDFELRFEAHNRYLLCKKK
jgi:hypothetical protein